MDTKNNNATNVANESNNEVMNQTIVRLNEFKAAKMASLSKSKRPASKFNKEVATYLLTNWDNVEALKTCIDAMRKDMPEGCEEVMNIYSERISALEPKQEKPQKKAASAKKSETKAEKPKTAKKSETKNEKPETAEKGKRGRKASHYVGEVHPKNPNWIWMEYAPGKFDWKSLRGKQAAEQFPDRAVVDTPETAKKSESKAEKPAKKQSKKSDKKQDKEAKKDAAPAKLTLDELLAKSTPSGLSKSQQSVLKAFKKGFRLRKDGNTLWLTNSNGDNMRVDKAVLEALQRRFNIDYEPNGIWLKK